MTEKKLMFDGDTLRMMSENEIETLREQAVEGLESGERKSAERYLKLVYNSGKVICMQQCA